ncbi:MAG: thioesterase family protein [Thermodesulfobacteriota bacterium]
MIKNEESIRVRYSEVDQLRFVYYSRYFEYFEIGRLSLLRVCGFPYDEMESKLGCYLPVVETYAKFHQPAKLEDIITIGTKILQKPSIILRFDYEILCEGILITQGYTTHVFLNGKTGKPGRPPIGLKELFDKSFKEKDV